MVRLRVWQDGIILFEYGYIDIGAIVESTGAFVVVFVRHPHGNEVSILCSDLYINCK